MKLSEYLRKENVNKFPISVIIKANNYNDTHDEYLELSIMNRTETDNDILYEIRCITNGYSYHIGDIVWVSETWCAKYELIKIFA